MITSKEFVRANLKPLDDKANKYSAGSAMIFAGSYGMAGAAVLSAKAALRSGAGIVRLVVPDKIYPICAVGVPEAVFSVVPTEDGKLSTDTYSALEPCFSKCGAVAFGPGLGVGEGVLVTLTKLLRDSTKPLIVDADGINVLSMHIDLLREKTCPLILTPHEGEMARLTGKSSDFIRENRKKVATEFAQQYGVTLLLKGKDTLIVSEKGEVAVNPTGNAGLATAGSGDVLTGIISAFLSQGNSPFEAAATGAFFHGLSADIAVRDIGERSLIASDIIEYLPKAFKEC